MFHLRSGEEINYFLTKKESKNTNNRHLCLLDFFEATDLHVNIEDCSKEEFKSVLRKFYVSSRKTNGERFKKTSLQNIR